MSLSQSRIILQAIYIQIQPLAIITNETVIILDLKQSYRALTIRPSEQSLMLKGPTSTSRSLNNILFSTELT